MLIVWRLDRLGRSLPHLIEVIRDIGNKGAGFRSLSESIDTTTAGGRLVFHMMGALAEFERALIGEADARRDRCCKDAWGLPRPSPCPKPGAARSCARC